MVVTINEGLGTIYDRFAKEEVITHIKNRYNPATITEIESVPIPLIDSAGIGLDTLLVSRLFRDIRLVYSSYANMKLAREFYGRNSIDPDRYSYQEFCDNEIPYSDLVFTNYAIEFKSDLWGLVHSMSLSGKLLLFFESNHNNFGHKLVNYIGRRFMIAPWVTYKSIRKPTPSFAIGLLKGMGLKVLDWGMIDFPFFAPASGVSPFKNSRKIRGTFKLKELSHIQDTLMRVGFCVERKMPLCVMHLSHMFWILARGD